MKKFCRMKGMSFPVLLCAMQRPMYPIISTGSLLVLGEGNREGEVQKPPITKTVQNHVLLLNIFQVCKAVVDMKRRRKMTAAGVEGRYFQR